MPVYLKRLQYKDDSVRAIKWFEMTKDSSYLKKYSWYEKKPLKREQNNFPSTDKNNSLAILNEKKYLQINNGAIII